MTLPPLPYGLEPEPAAPATKRGFGSGAGRRVGQKDKITIALKEAILLAGEEAGDAIAAQEPGRTAGLAGYLLHVAATDTRAFCGLLGKVLPMQVTGAGDGPVVVEIVRMASNASVGN